MPATHTISGTIGSVSISGYVRSSRRQESLCSPGQHLTLVLEPDWSGTANPAEICLLSEDGTSVIRGYVIKSKRARPSYDWQIEIDDDFTRLQNTFVTDQLKANTIRSCSSWATQILNLCGVSSISFQGADANIPPGTEFGLRSAWEALQSIMAYASWYLRFDTNGTAIFNRVEDGAEDYTFSSDIIEFSQEVGDETTRNVIKVYGAGQVGLNGDRIFTSVSRSLHGIVPDRIAAVGSPLIETQAEAGRVANYLLAELGRVTEYKLVTAPGNPSVRIGQKARIIHQSDGFFYNGVDVITSAEHSLDENGYIMDLKLGERCPRIAGWSQHSNPVYAGTSGSGVFRSVDGGITWTAYNTGLTAGNKYAGRLAFNSFDEGMAIINGRLFHHNGLTWESVSLPAPVNTAGDSPAPGYGAIIAIDSLGFAGGFAALTVNGATSGSINPSARTWVYETQDGGHSWTSTQIDSGTGSGWHVHGLDLSSRLGLPYVVATSGSVTRGIPRLSENTIQNTKSGFPMPCSFFLWGVTNWSITGIHQTGTAPSRTVAITFLVNVVTRGGIFVESTFIRTACTPGTEMLTRSGYISHNPAESGITFVAAGHDWPEDVGNEALLTTFTLNYNESVLSSVFSARLVFEHTTRFGANTESQAWFGAEAECFDIAAARGYAEYNASVWTYDFDDPMEFP